MTQACRFNFGSREKSGCLSVRPDGRGGVPSFDPNVGYGFVRSTSAMPAREVRVEAVRADEDGLFIVEDAFDFFGAEPDREQASSNRFGMVFRIQAPPGAYRVQVKTTSAAADTAISVSAMHPDRLLQGGFWDAARLIPVRFPAEWSGRTWTYAFVNGRGFLDIEIEPRFVGVPVGVEEIVLEPLAASRRDVGSLPTVYLLGDSTVKSYTFDESPMSGWGQVLGSLFDGGRINVVNYSMGGRSFKSSYQEGRLNDILLTGRIGDYVLIQFGHNDESLDENRRFGRGSTEAMYEAYLMELYLPAIRSRGLIPILVTPLSRVNGDEPAVPFADSFTHRRFPELLRRLAAKAGVTLVDLNAESLRYYNEIGLEATIACFMSIEAGETPGKTNDGSYANGHPANKIDGTHYKEALSKPFARIVATELAKLGQAGDAAAAAIAAALREDVKQAIRSGDWSAVYPETTRDTATGAGSYYRNQIEKLIQLGVLAKDGDGNFRPEEEMTVHAFARALARLLSLPSSQLLRPSLSSRFSQPVVHSIQSTSPSAFAAYPDGALTRETMAAILSDAYHARFAAKPQFMTDYNGTTVVPGDPGCDPNLDASAQGPMYDPLVPFERLTDTAELAPHLAAKAEDAYRLGLIRAEKGIVRGRMENGTELEPRKIVTRAKAAKALIFMWVLGQPVLEENHRGALAN